MLSIQRKQQQRRYQARECGGLCDHRSVTPERKQLCARDQVKSGDPAVNTSLLVLRENFLSVKKKKRVFWWQGKWKCLQWQRERKKGTFKGKIRQYHRPQLLSHPTLMDQYPFHVSKCKKSLRWTLWQQTCWSRRVQLTGNSRPGWFVCLHQTLNHCGNHQRWPYNLRPTQDWEPITFKKPNFCHHLTFLSTPLICIHAAQESGFKDSKLI